MKAHFLAAALVTAFSFCFPVSAGEKAIGHMNLQAPAHACKSFRPSNVAWDCGRMLQTGSVGSETGGGVRSR